MTVDTVFVTGAAGFIGSRLTHRLALGEAVDVRALIHTVTGPNAMRLGRLPIDIKQGSILDAERMDELVTGCDAIVHCAFGDEETTVDGTRTMLQVAEDNGIESFVHLSTAAVHGIDFEGTIDESSPFDPQTEYAAAKAEAERVLHAFAETSTLSPTVLRPFIVYGPHSTFVEGPFSEVTSGAILADGGFGPFNQIYVDNLVDAIILALTTERARGETMIAVDDERVSWRQYYHRLGAIAGDHPPIRDLSVEEIRVKRTAKYMSDSVRPPFDIARDIVSSTEVRSNAASSLNRAPWIRSAFHALPERMQTGILRSVKGGEHEFFSEAATANGQSTDAYDLPTQRYEWLHASMGTAENTHLKDILGWEQRVSFDEAMALIEGWLRYEEIA